MPEIRARYPDLPPPMTGDAKFVRARLFEAVALLGCALSAGGPVVLALDDMQWADADTLDLVHYLAWRWAETGAPILLLLAIRQEAYAADAALREWLIGVGRDAPLTRLLLESLSGAAVERLVQLLAGESRTEPATAASVSSFAAWLWAETRGLPFFIEALLQMLVEQGILPVTGESGQGYEFAAALEQVRSIARVPLPPGVGEVILARLAQHSKEANALLLAAAVVGRSCTFERLCQVSDLSEASALEALEELLDGRLMAELPSDRRPYTPAHDYIREVVYRESREVRRRVFHRRALLSLEASEAPAAECAFHALAALLDEPAFRFSVAAGTDAFASYATQEALTHFDTARSVARRLEERGEQVDMELLGRLYRHRGQALEIIQDDRAAQDNYEEMRAIAAQRRDRGLELAALISLSNLHGTYTGVFNPPRARELAQEALALSREVGDKAAEAGALSALTVAEFFSAGDSSQIMAYGQATLALARELGLKELVGKTLNILCWPLVGEKQLEQARDVLSEASAIWRELGDLPQLGEALRFMLIIHYIAGDYRRILAEAPELDELGASTGSRLDRLNAVTWLAHAHVRQGRFGRALDCVEESGALSAAIGHSNEEQSHAFVRFGLYLAAGALEEAELWADRLYAQRDTIMPTLVQYYLTGVARVKIARRKLDEGRAILDNQLATMEGDTPAAQNITTVAVIYSELQLSRGRTDDLFAGLEERARPYREAGFNSLLADEFWLRGRAEMALGRYDAARWALLKAKEAAEAQEERAVLWQILVSLADVETACGDAATAGRLRDVARGVVCDIAEHAGSLRDVFLGRPDVAQLLGRPDQKPAES
jgi:tetratricopeptide (TPR) repeat protein